MTISSFLSLWWPLGLCLCLISSHKGVHLSWLCSAAFFSGNNSLSSPSAELLCILWEPTWLSPALWSLSNPPRQNQPTLPNACTAVTFGLVIVPPRPQVPGGLVVRPWCVAQSLPHTHVRDTSIGLFRPHLLFYLCFYTEILKVTHWAWLCSPLRPFLENGTFSTRVSTMNATSFTGLMVLTQGRSPEWVHGALTPSQLLSAISLTVIFRLAPESLNWFLTREWKRCIIYCSPAKPPTPDICVMLCSLQNTSTSDISRVVNKAH